MTGHHAPWFKFYPADFMNGVRGLSAQEVGLYTMLLARIYEENGPVEYHPLRLSTYCGMREATFVKTLEKLLALGKITLRDGMLSCPTVIEWMAEARREARRSSIPLKVQRDVQGEGCCAYCGAEQGPFEIDHIHPWSRGGTDDRENLTLACRPCNRSKRDKTLAEWMQ